MKAPKIHPQLAKLHDQLGRHPGAVALSGYVGPSSDGYVRVYPSADLSTFVEIPEAAVLHHEQEDEEAETELYIDPLAVVTVTSTQSVPLIVLALRQADDTPDGGDGEKSCLETRIEKCKRDPMRNPEFCDSERGKRLLQLLCDLLGDPPQTSQGGGSLIV